MDYSHFNGREDGIRRSFLEDQVEPDPDRPVAGRDFSWAGDYFGPNKGLNLTALRLAFGPTFQCAAASQKRIVPRLTLERP